MSRGELERELKQELHSLDHQIEALKNKLSKAAIAQSQKILTEVIDNSLSQLQNLQIDV